MINAISHSELLQLVDYDQKTGIITRKVRTSNRVHIGDTVGSLSGNDYLVGHIGGFFAYIHQFAWLFVHGVWPDHDIDHRDKDTLNNKIKNLRRATESQNAANTGVRADNTSGFKGVHPKRNKWCSQIRCDGKRITLGSFDTPEAAHAAYSDAATRLFGEFARVA